MSFDSPIVAPAGYLPGEVIAFASDQERAVLVSRATPLPVAVTVVAGGAPFAGTATASAVVGPFTPQPGREVMLTLAGSWSGSAALLRSVDGGTTRLPATLAGDALAWTGNVQEPVWVEPEAGATLWLAITRTAGTLSYRLAQ